MERVAERAKAEQLSLCATATPPSAPLVRHRYATKCATKYAGVSATKEGSKKAVEHGVKRIEA